MPFKGTAYRSEHWEAADLKYSSAPLFPTATMHYHEDHLPAAH